MTPTLRQEIEMIAARLDPALRDELEKVAIRAGQVERLADELVANSMEEARLPVYVPPRGIVVQFPRRPIPVHVVGEELRS
jgi:hypothetical protein